MYKTEGSFYVQKKRRSVHDRRYKHTWKSGIQVWKAGDMRQVQQFSRRLPAIWLLPVQRQYPNPPGANEYGGEIDIMEQVSLEKVAWHTVHSHYTLDLGLDKNPPRAGGGAYKENEFNLYTRMDSGRADIPD